MNNLQLPPGALPSTAISIGVPTNTPEIRETLLNWHKASVPQTIDQFYENPTIDPDVRAAVKREKAESPDTYNAKADAFAQQSEASVKKLEEKLESGKLVLVLHNNKPVHNGIVIDVKGLKKQVSLFAADELHHFALATLDDRTQTMQQAMAQLFVMFNTEAFKKLQETALTEE